MKIYLTSDHGGFELKNHLTNYLKEHNFDVVDIGPHQLNPNDDYPVYASKIAKALQEDSESLGIISCRNGVGISIAANKFDGIRAALSWDKAHAITTRLDDNANILSLPSDYIDNKKAEEIVLAWVNTQFEPKERFTRRLEEVKKIEENN